MKPTNEVARSLALNWGVYPVVIPVFKSTDEIVVSAKQEASKFMHLESGDIIVVTGGFNVHGVSKATNFLKIEQI
jgi:pyruvate kinase